MLSCDPHLRGPAPLTVAAWGFLAPPPCCQASCTRLWSPRTRCWHTLGAFSHRLLSVCSRGCRHRFDRFSHSLPAPPEPTMLGIFVPVTAAPAAFMSHEVAGARLLTVCTLEQVSKRGQFPVGVFHSRDAARWRLIRNSSIWISGGSPSSLAPLTSVCWQQEEAVALGCTASCTFIACALPAASSCA